MHNRRAWARLSGLVGADVSHGAAAGVRKQLGITVEELRTGKEGGGGRAPAGQSIDAEEGEGDDDDDDGTAAAAR